MLRWYENSDNSVPFSEKKNYQKLQRESQSFEQIFLSQSNPIPNNSKLPENQTYITETKLSSFNIEDEDIYKIIKTIDINKANGHGEVSIKIL